MIISGEFSFEFCYSSYWMFWVFTGALFKLGNIDKVEIESKIKNQPNSLFIRKLSGPYQSKRYNQWLKESSLGIFNLRLRKYYTKWLKQGSTPQLFQRSKAYYYKWKKEGNMYKHFLRLYNYITKSKTFKFFKK